MLITIDAPTSVQVMFIGYVALDEETGELFASQHCTGTDEINARHIVIKKVIDRHE